MIQECRVGGAEGYSALRTIYKAGCGHRAARGVELGAVVRAEAPSSQGNSSAGIGGERFWGSL